MAEALEEIRFGGSLPAAHPLKVAPFRKKEGANNVFDILEQAFFKLVATDEGKAQYGDPEKGATLEQAWRASGLFTGKLPVCLLATGKPSVPLSAIDRVIRMNPRQLVDAVRALMRLSARPAIQTFYHDGNIGHCITLIGWDENTDRFRLIDPWPDFSLLSKGYNAAGIDAQRLDNGAWSITAAELERVIFACFVARNFWAEYSEEKYYIEFTDLMVTDFWRFFHLKIEEVQHENGMTFVRLKPGGPFASQIDLYSINNIKERIVEGVLSLKRTWILGGQNGLNPYALDIVKSFITTFIAPPDVVMAADVVELFRQLPDKNLVAKLVQRNNYLADLVKVYFGFIPEVKIPFNFSQLTAKNEKIKGVDVISFEVTIDAL
jgi:hypothetical protein